MNCVRAVRPLDSGLCLRVSPVPGCGCRPRLEGKQIEVLQCKQPNLKSLYETHMAGPRRYSFRMRMVSFGSFGPSLALSWCSFRFLFVPFHCICFLFVRFSPSVDVFGCLWMPQLCECSTHGSLFGNLGFTFWLWLSGHVRLSQ